MPKLIPDSEKERLIDMSYSAVRSGLANGDYQNIDIKIKAMLRDHLAGESYDAQIYMLRELIVYLRRRIQVPGGRLGAIALINVGRIKGVPTFLTDAATAVWGTLFSGKANSSKLHTLLLT